MATGYRLYLDTGAYGPSIGDGISGTSTYSFTTYGLSPSAGAYVSYPGYEYEISGLVYDTGGGYYFVPHNEWELPAGEAGTISVVQTPHYLGSGTDYYTAGAGDDLIYSGPGATYDGTGNDYINAGAGDDQVFFGDGYDTVYGGDGNDVIGGYASIRWGNNLLSGDAGNDTIVGGENTDTIHGGTGNDWIAGAAGNDYLYGDDDEDLFLLTDGHGGDYIDGGEGGSDYDAIQFNTWLSTAGVSVTFSGHEAGSYNYVEAGAGTWGSFHHIEAIYGTGYADTIDASYSGYDQVLSANEGDDIVTGGYGDDLIYGGSGEDTLTGGAGDDTFFFENGFGSDSVSAGETGEVSGDTLDFSAVTAPLTMVFSGDESGTVGDGADTVGFDEIEGLVLGSGADFLSAGSNTGGIFVDAGAGADTLWAGSGDDSLQGGLGDDEIFGDSGADSILGGDGADDLGGDGGNDTIFGGAGDDWIQGNAGANRLSGDGGDDTFEVFTGQGGTDTITGGNTDETTGDSLAFTGADAASVTFTGDEAGTYTAGTASGTYSEIEVLGLTDQADVVDASAAGVGVDVDAAAGDDTVTGGSGGDTVLGGTGADSLDGGNGDDRLTGGTGDDTLTGGAGDDTFVYSRGDGADTITDFNTGNTGTLSDGDSTNNDFIDLSDFYDDIWELQADLADDAALNQSNDGVDGVDYSDNTRFETGDSLTFTGASADGSSFTVENTGIVCFARGTAILTPAGEVPVERLRAGDRVVTADHGVQTIRWLGSRRVARSPALQPVRIGPGALGAGLPRRALYVSPQHRLLVRSRVAARMTGGRDVLVAAKQLAALRGIRRDDRKGHVRYFHILCDHHEIVFANGAPAETLLPGPMARRALGPETWAELVAILPDIEARLARGRPARPILEGPRRAGLLRRHRRNRVPLFEPAPDPAP